MDQPALRKVDHSVRYEALRAHIVEQQSWVGREGLVVLLREGVAAWIDVWAKLPTPPRRSKPSNIPRPPPLFDDAGTEVVRILTAMTLGHIEEVHA